MKSFLRFVLLALGLLLISLVSALTAIRVAIHGREAHVPELRDRTVAEAKRAAGEEGLQVAVERQYYSATVAEGRVLTQVPVAGTLVRKGWQVRVAESLGPQRAEVPNVLGQSERAAEINLRRRDLGLAEVDYLNGPGTEPDLVVGQSPPANAGHVAAPRISLLVTEATPPSAYVMPSFLGQRLGSVRQAIQDAGIKTGPVGFLTDVGGEGSLSTASEADVVAWQDPPAGQKVVSGTTVALKVH